MGIEEKIGTRNGGDPPEEGGWERTARNRLEDEEDEEASNGELDKVDTSPSSLPEGLQEGRNV